MTENLSQQIQQILEKLNKLDKIEEKINKLDNIKSKVESFNTKLYNVIEKSVASLKFEMEALKEKQNMMEQSLEDFKASVDFSIQELTQ